MTIIAYILLLNIWLVAVFLSLVIVDIGACTTRTQWWAKCRDEVREALLWIGLRMVVFNILVGGGVGMAWLGWWLFH